MPLRIGLYTSAAFAAGHHQRLGNLARSLLQLRGDLEVDVIQPEIYGGLSFEPAGGLPGCRMVELPCPVQVELAPGELLPLEHERQHWREREDIREARRRVLDEAIAARPIDLLYLENYPFLAAIPALEIEHLISRMRERRPQAPVVVSARDILFSRRVDVLQADVRRRVEEFVRRRVAKILIHSDPNLIRLEESYGDTSGLEAPMSYTGIVVPEVSSPMPKRGPHVVCSQGGERRWRHPMIPFLQAWESLCRSGRLPRDARGYVFLGFEHPGEDLRRVVDEYRSLFEAEDAGVQLGEWDGYADLASSATCSVSQCGYNTAYELLSWGTPAIFCPRSHDGPTEGQIGEQPLRTAKLAERGWASVAETPEQIAEEIARRFEQPAAPRPSLDFSGAETTARILVETAEAAR